jgi:hypothetical protein
VGKLPSCSVSPPGPHSSQGSCPSSTISDRPNRSLSQCMTATPIAEDFSDIAQRLKASEDSSSDHCPTPGQRRSSRPIAIMRRTMTPPSGAPRDRRLHSSFAYVMETRGTNSPEAIYRVSLVTQARSSSALAPFRGYAPPLPRPSAAHIPQVQSTCL